MVKEHLNKIDNILKEMTDTGYVAGINCMILRDGKPIYYGESGYIDLEKKNPVKKDSIFRLYSMTKPITSAAVMCLVEDGKIDLNQPVGDFIPSYKDQIVADRDEKYSVRRPMKVKDLLDMTSGLTYGGETNITEIQTEKLCAEAISRLNSKDEMSTIEFASRLGEIPLIFNPGESYRYSYSADVLGAIVETVSGMKYGEFLKKRLFEPLGMKDTGFYVPKEKQNRLSKVYQPSEYGLKEYTYNHLAINLCMDHEPAFQSGGAGLCSTIEDYAKFANMLMNNGLYEGKRIMQPGTVKFMTSGCLDEGPAEEFKNWDGLSGFTYSNLLRVLKNPGLAVTAGSKGEYGWDGWLGPYFSNDPKHKITILEMIQRTDAGTTYYMRRIRNVVYAAIED